MEKIRALYRAKRLATLLLLLAAALFIVTLFLPINACSRALKSVAEAALVGALADWFAVTALFRPIPIPFIKRHTAIIPRNKTRIARNLGKFVEEKFLPTESLISLIKRYDVAQFLAFWLAVPGNIERTNQKLIQIAHYVSQVISDRQIQRLLRNMGWQLMDNINFSQSIALILQGLINNRRYQALMDVLLKYLVNLLRKPATRRFIAKQIVFWLKREHPLVAKFIPSAWFGQRGAKLIERTVNATIDEMVSDQGHVFRQTAHRALLGFIDRLKQDESMQQQVATLVTWLKQDKQVNQYINQLAIDLRCWLAADLALANSQIKARIHQMMQWLTNTLHATRYRAT